MNQMKLGDLIDASIIQRIQDSFCEFTGMSSVVVDEDGKPVTKETGSTDFCSKLTGSSRKGLVRCLECRKAGTSRANETGKPAVFVCHTGLAGFSVPIMLNGRSIGNIIGGQACTSELDEETLRRYAAEMDIDPDTFVNNAKNLPYIPAEQMEKAANYLADLAQSISLMAYDNYIESQKTTKTQRAERSRVVFLSGLNEDLSISMKGWLDSISDSKKKFADEPAFVRELDRLMAMGQDVYSVVGGAVDFINRIGSNADYSEKKYSIRGLFSDILKRHGEKAEQYGAEITVAYDEGLPEMFIGSAGKLEQLVTKLILYSIRHNKKGGKININVSCEKETYSANLIIRIVNTESGIDKGFLSELNRSFENGENNIFEENGISSFDFMLIPMLVRQMSGRIEGQSFDEEKIEFCLTIPQLISDK